MEKKVIDLQLVFVMNNEYLVKNLNECFAVLNEFLKEKSGVTHDPLFIREEKGIVRVGYVPNSSGKTHFFSDEKIPGSFETLERIILVQFVIFEGCKEYGCYESVPMAGAPEEGHDAYFTFTHKDVEYTYKLWTKG